METMTIVINSTPYGDERVWDALRLALTCVSAAIDLNVNIFLIGDAVSAVKKGQNTPQGYYNVEKTLRDLIGLKVKIAACGTCLRARGIEKDDSIEGIEIGTMMNLAHWIKESQKTLSF